MHANYFYLAAVTFGLCVAYLLLEHLFSLFFTKHFAHIGRRSIGSVAIIVVTSILGYVLTLFISDPESSNRVLHMFGGGFLAIMVCFLVVKDSRITITKFQFFIFSFMVVTTLGVGNEIMEFFLQNYGGLIATTTLNDTWFDLIANTTGIFVASICFTPFIPDTLGEP